MKKFILKKSIPGCYIMLKKGYSGNLEYPNIEEFDKIGICEGHGEYTWVDKKDVDIVIIYNSDIKNKKWISIFKNFIQRKLLI